MDHPQGLLPLAELGQVPLLTAEAEAEADMVGPETVSPKARDAGATSVRTETMGTQESSPVWGAIFLLQRKHWGLGPSQNQLGVGF